MKHIVVVEDDESIRFIFGIALKPGLYDLTLLATCDAIMNEEVEAPELFVLDKQLSGVNGLDVCRFIKSSGKYGHVPVILVSAAPDIFEHAREAGAEGALMKPFSLRDLRETVSHYSTYTCTTTVAMG
ncbi:response regulator [Chitinophaga rhizophila]|uniref:Response regulator n=1 Tax=Chitinophaga rhizophila TaxID=2866212 RepID=A0ABS7GH96_9BACT|nr:response regulator [Chitinophaga rhizophila]MBW8687069.1 response regulator [Chitinophaga rhizophila]